MNPSQLGRIECAGLVSSPRKKSSSSRLPASSKISSHRQSLKGSTYKREEMPEGEKLEKESNDSEWFGRGGRAMDTPKQNQITTPLSKVEDSPFFNYINSLSPIKTIKSTHISQTFNSFNFATLPSVFTSPRISSFKEARFLKRHHFSDPSKLEFSSRNENKVGAIESVMGVAINIDEQQEYFDPRSCIGVVAEPTYECSELATDVSEMLVYDCGGPDGSASPCHGTGTNYGPDFAGSLDSAVQSVQSDPESGFLGNVVQLEGTSMTEENKEGAGRDWENISDVSGLLMIDSPDEEEAFKGHFQKQLDSGTRLHISLISELAHDEGAQSFGPDVLEHCEPENPPSEVEEEGCPMEIEATGDILVSTCTHTHVAEKSEQIDNESVSALRCDIRRRCLVFETGGACEKHLNDTSSSCFSLSRSDVDIESNDKQLVPVNSFNESSCCIIPGIGLHLNALVTTSSSKNYNISSPELLTTDKEYVDKSLAVVSVDIGIIPSENIVEELEDASQASGYIMANEEINNQCSPKKKRRKLENAGESEDCKRCNCKKTKCLKLYCECFAAGLYCVEPCSCVDCLNKPVYEDTVLSTRKQIESRNPLAFAPKVIRRSSDSVPGIGDDSSSRTPASARHKRGCNCKKSGCLKKYCECYQGGVGCSINCRCEGCKNAFGRKDGPSLIGAEAELEEEKTDEKSVVNENLQQNVIQNNVEQNPDSTLPATPLRHVRESTQLPFSSLGFGKPNFQSKFEKRIQNVLEEEDQVPEILQGHCSPISSIKSVSPNSKRVSPPHCSSDFGMSSDRRSSRKLILRSIPSFPSLNTKD